MGRSLLSKKRGPPVPLTSRNLRLKSAINVRDIRPAERGQLESILIKDYRCALQFPPCLPRFRHAASFSSWVFSKAPTPPAWNHRSCPSRRTHDHAGMTPRSPDPDRVHFRRAFGKGCGSGDLLHRSRRQRVINDLRTGAGIPTTGLLSDQVSDQIQPMASSLDLSTRSWGMSIKAASRQPPCRPC